MRKNILMSVIAISLLILNGVCVCAEELPEKYSDDLTYLLQESGYDVVDVETTVLNDSELQEHVIVEAPAGAAEKQYKVNSSNAICDDNDVDMDVQAMLYHYSVEKDGVAEDIYSITASAKQKYSIDQKGELIGTICWIDNIGPRNQLLYVSGTYPPGYNAAGSGTFKYWVTGFEGSTLVRKYWSGQFFNSSASNYYGLQFVLNIHTFDGVSLQLTTTPVD